MGPIIDITPLFPYRILMHIAEVFAYYNIAHSITKDKYHPAITIAAIFAAKELWAALLFNTPIESAGFVCFGITLFIVLKFLTDGQTTHKAMSAVFSIISKFSSTFFYGMISVVVYQGKNYEEIFGTENNNLNHLYMFLCHCILTIAVSYIFSGILKFFYRKKNASGNNNKLLLLFSFFPVSHIMIVVFALMTVPSDYSKYPEVNLTALGVIVFAFMLIVMLFDCLFPFAMDYFEAIEERNLLNERALTKSKMEYQQVLMRKEDQQEFRKVKHDYANLISAAKGFIEIGKPEKALEILQRTNDDITGLSRFSLCSNETVNTIIYMKKQEAEKNRIKVKAEVEEHYSLNVYDHDFCRVLGNIIDNAVNALKKFEGEKLFRLSIEIDEDFVRIKGENPFDAAKEKKKRRSKDHGHGTIIIKDIASKYDGSYNVRQENGIWYTDTVLRNIKIK